MMCQCIHCKSEFHVKEAKSGPNAPLCPVCGKEFIVTAEKQPFEMNLSHALAMIALPCILLPAAGIPIAVAGIILGVKKHSTGAVILNILALLLALVNGIYGIYFSRSIN